MSLYNDIDWTTGSHEICVYNSLCVVDYAGNFPGGHRAILRTRCEEKVAFYSRMHAGAWNRVAEEIVESFGDSGHLVFRGKSRVSPRNGEMTGWRSIIDTLQCGTPKCMSCCCAFWPPTSLVFTEPSRIGAEISISEQKVILERVC